MDNWSTFGVRFCGRRGYQSDVGGRSATARWWTGIFSLLEGALGLRVETVGALPKLAGLSLSSLNRNGLRLAVVVEEEADGDTAKLYGAVRDHFELGFVPDVFQLLGSRPEFLRVMWDTYLVIFEEGVLSREVKELIALVVARDASCAYCEGAHSLLAEVIGVSPEVIGKLRESDANEAFMESRLSALFNFISQIDLTPSAISDSDVARLGHLGWSDDELIEAIWTACVFNGIVRLVESFGLFRLGQLREELSTTRNPPAAEQL